MVDKNTNNVDKTANSGKIDSSNIFDEFVQDADLINEVDKDKKSKTKDMFYYFSKFGKVFQIIFGLLLFTSFLLYSYIFVQNDNEFSNSNFLDPICFLILDDIEKSDPFCSSISYVNKNYSTKLENIKTDQSKEILNILEKLYEVENFTKTKEILFLVDKSNTKLPVLEILDEFDKLKNEFDEVDKQKVECNNLQISSESKTLSFDCYANSAGYEKGLRGYDGTKNFPLKGTSISIANSFLNYISKQSDIFTLTERQKIFTSESLLGEKSDFTNRTSFKLKLSYNLN